MKRIEKSPRAACIHSEKRLLKREGRGNPLDKRPDIVFHVCNFPLPEPSRIQCTTKKSRRCPCGGPYGFN